MTSKFKRPCPNCKKYENHFVPPSLGEAGFFICAASKLPSAPSPATRRMKANPQRVGTSHETEHEQTLACCAPPQCRPTKWLPEPVSTEGATAKPKCVDCRDYETNIRKWIAQLGGTPDVQHISLELERLIDVVAAPIAPAAPDIRTQAREEVRRLLNYQTGHHSDVLRAANAMAVRAITAERKLAAQPSAEGDGWIAELRCGLELVAHALADENVEHVAPWTRMRKWLNQRDVYNGDLQEHRVTLEVVKILLALLPAPPSGQGEKR